MKNSLFIGLDTQRKKRINGENRQYQFQQANDVIIFASSGILINWRKRQDFISPEYTLRWEALKEVI